MQTDVRTFNKKKVLIGVRRSYKFKRGVFMDIGTAIYERFLQGEEQALDELVNLYRNSLTSFINGYIGDYDEAEDIMIDVFVDLIQKRKNFKGNSSFKTYLFSIGRNKAYKHMHGKSRQIFISIDEVADFLPSDDPSLENDIIRQIQNEELNKAIADLKSDYREVIYLMYFENLSYDEIAKVMKKSTKQMSNLAYRARQSLKGQILKRSENYEQQQNQ